LLKARINIISNESCCVLEMFLFIVQNKLNLNIAYFQYTADTGCSVKRNYLYVGLKVTEQNEFSFYFDNDHTTQHMEEVNNWAI
jgi:hypothetical protein